jgi:hypothetical protein
LLYPYSTIEVRGETESDSKIGDLVGRVSDLVKDSSHIVPAFPLERSCEGQAGPPTSVVYLDRIRDCVVIGLAVPAGAAADNPSKNVVCGVPIK